MPQKLTIRERLQLEPRPPVSLKQYPTIVAADAWCALTAPSPMGAGLSIWMGREFTDTEGHEEVLPTYSMAYFLPVEDTDRPSITENHAQVMALALLLSLLPDKWEGMILTGSIEVMYLMKRHRTQCMRGVPQELLSYIHEEKRRVYSPELDTLHVKLPRQEMPVAGSIAQIYESCSSAAKRCVRRELLCREFEHLCEVGGTLEEVGYNNKDPEYQWWCERYGIDPERLRT